MNAPILALQRSPHAAMTAVSVDSVQLKDRLLQPLRETIRTVTLPSQIELCRNTGRVRNFQIAAGTVEGKFEGIYFNDSDVYKLLEALAWSLASHPDAALEAEVDELTAIVASAQQPDGYLNTYFMFEREKDRFSNLRDMHELYCAGHLIQAAVAHHRATGKTTLLQVAVKLSECLWKHFGPEGRLAACGHEECEMALVELYRDTGDARWLQLAHRMVQARGQKPGMAGGDRYHQDHAPVEEQKDVTGHAVRQLYLASGVADLLLEQELPEYMQAQLAIWENFVNKRIYINGGAGARYEGEAFGTDYELPNDRAYAETCAAIASIMWNYRMLHLTGEARFADLMEITLYNAALPGISLDGKQYFYENPLENDGTHRRSPWFGCACCPPNIARLLGQLPGMFASTRANTLFVHLYASAAMQLNLENNRVELEIETDMPWQGKVTIRAVRADAPFTLALRIPHWAPGASVSVNGADADSTLQPNSYAKLENVGQGDVIVLNLPMKTALLASHPWVSCNYGQAAVSRGPLVYCLEQTDNPDCDVRDILLPVNASFEPCELKNLPGVQGLKAAGACRQPEGGSGPLHQLLHPEAAPPAVRPVTITAVPYYAWANREAGPMRVWIPLTH